MVYVIPATFSDQRLHLIFVEPHRDLPPRPYHGRHARSPVAKEGPGRGVRACWLAAKMGPGVTRARRARRHAGAERVAVTKS